MKGSSPGRRTALLPAVPSRPPLRTPTRRQATVTSLRDFNKRRPRTVRGVAAAAVTIPLALLILSQGSRPRATQLTPPPTRGHRGFPAEPQPTTPVVPALPVAPATAEAVPAEAVPPADDQPAEVINLQEPAPAPVQAPAPAPAAEPGTDIAKEKSDGKSEKKPEKAKGNGEGK